MISLLFYEMDFSCFLLWNSRFTTRYLLLKKCNLRKGKFIKWDKPCILHRLSRVALPSFSMELSRFQAVFHFSSPAGSAWHQTLLWQLEGLLWDPQQLVTNPLSSKLWSQHREKSQLFSIFLTSELNLNRSKNNTKTSWHEKREAIFPFWALALLREIWLTRLPGAPGDFCCHVYFGNSSVSFL